MSPKIMSFVQTKNKIGHNLGYSFCMNGFNFQLDESFQFRSDVRISYNTLSSKYPDKYVKSGEVGGHENPSWYSAGYRFDTTVCSKMSGRTRSTAPVALRTPSQKRNVSVFHLPTVADSAAFSAETTTSHHDRFSMQCWMSPQSVVLIVAHFLLGLLLPPALHRQLLPYEQMRYACVARTFIKNTHTSCFFKLFNNPVEM
jgi:hypothetical protein